MPKSESILYVFELPYSQVHREVEPEVADATQDAQSSFEAGLGHVAPRLVVRVYQRARFTQQVEPGHEPLLVQSHAHQSFELRVRSSLVAPVLLQNRVDGPKQGLLGGDFPRTATYIQAEGLGELASRRLHEGLPVSGVVVLHEKFPRMQNLWGGSVRQQAGDGGQHQTHGLGRREETVRQQVLQSNRQLLPYSRGQLVPGAERSRAGVAHHVFDRRVPAGAQHSHLVHGRLQTLQQRPVVLPSRVLRPHALRDVAGRAAELTRGEDLQNGEGLLDELKASFTHPLGLLWIHCRGRKSGGGQSGLINARNINLLIRFKKI